MKFKVLGVVLALFIVLACGFTVLGEETVAAPSETPEISADATSTDEKVLVARLENMLDHNNVYNDDFDSTYEMVNNSIIALIDKGDEDGFIKADIVEGFVYNMYGITLNDYAINPEFPQKDGYIFILPRGFELYDHTLTSVEVDGDYIHTDSVLTVVSHEGYTYEYDCRSIFKVNASSAFGCNLISCIYY